MRPTTVQLLMITLLATATLAATPPERVHYQGVLRDAAGQPLDGSYPMTLRFFDDAAGGDELLVNLPPDVTVSGGLFGVEIGSGSVLDGAGPGSYDTLSRMFGNFDEVWMEIQIGAETLSPRVRVVAAPFALNAARLGGRIPSGFIDTSADPQSKAGALDVGALSVTGALTLDGLGPGSGKVLTSDATGQASWQTLPVDADASTFDRLARLVDVDPGDPGFQPPATLGAFDCSGANSATMSFSLDGVPTGSVVAFVGKERISTPYEFLVAISTTTSLTPGSQLGKLGRLTIARPGASSTFSGRVEAFGSAGASGGERLYVARLVPELAGLERSTGYRIYQELGADDILDEILGAAGISGMNLVGGTYDTTDMTVQYAESSLAFFGRIAERSGIHYHFREQAAGELLVLGDANAHFPALATPLSYYGEQQDPGTGEEYIRSFQAPQQQSSASAVVRGYDFRSPAAPIEATSAGAGDGELFEFYADRVASAGEAGLLAARLREADLARSQDYAGTSNAADFRAGQHFTLTDTTSAGLGASYLLTEVTHYADAGDPSCIRYGNRFRALPDSVTFRPARTSPKPIVDGPLTAVVTGPAGEETYTDEYGRIKVQFIWDRFGQSDENSSAWIRLATPPGKGGQQRYLPEIGDEVLVDFMQGDPDQPVVLGSLYNDAALPPQNDRMVLTSGELVLDGDGPEGPQAIYFYDAGSAFDESLSWDDAADEFILSNDLLATDITATGNDFRFGTGARLSSSVSLTLFAVGVDNTDDALIYAGNSLDDGALRIFGDSTFELRSGNGFFSFANGSSSVQTAELDGSGNLQIDGVATISGSSVLLGAGGTLTGTTTSTSLLGGNAESDDLFLRAGTITNDGEIGILGGSQIDLRAGNGFFNFRNGDNNFVMPLQQSSAAVNAWRFGGANLELSLGDSSLDTALVPGDLQVSGTKNFVQNHPERDDLSIVYTALEGDEAGTYTRGSGRLVGGEATIELGATFAWVTHPEVGLTAHVTPRGARAELWVESVTPERLVVRGSDGAAFDYVVYGLRIGYEQHSVLQPRRVDGRVPSPEYYDTYYAAHPEHRALNAFERFGGSTRAASERAAGLRESIGEHGAVESSPPSEVAPRSVAAVDPSPTPEPIAGAEADQRPRPSPELDAYARVLRTEESELATAIEVDGQVELGDLIALHPDDPSRLAPASRPADPTVIGIVSGRPGLVLGGATEAPRVPVAFSGIVVAKVDAGYGSIRPGDLLSSSPTAGHAMRADEARPGTIVAKALEGLDSGAGTIRVLVMLR